MRNIKSTGRFYCPKCGGMIIKPPHKTNNDIQIISIANDIPTCDTCKSEFLIIIRNDFSFELIDKEGYGK